MIIYCPVTCIVFCINVKWAKILIIVVFLYSFNKVFKKRIQVRSIQIHAPVTPIKNSNPLFLNNSNVITWHILLSNPKCFLKISELSRHFALIYMIAQDAGQWIIRSFVRSCKYVY